MKRIAWLLAGALLCACAGPGEAPVERPDYYGTLEPFAAEAVYFIVTDRFVDGDAANNYPDQGGVNGSFDNPVQLDGERPANIGYLGGDFRGVLDNAGYIAEMGFTAVWLTPIIDNPDESFTGGIRPGQGFGADLGKSGYHGYWGVNFFAVDEHLESDGLVFADLTRRLRDDYGLKFVLDVVCNHGSPAYTMPVDQPKFGELYDADGVLIADHQNLHPGDLDNDNALHDFFSREPDLAQLADFDPDNPAVLDYFVAAYSHWLEQGVAAFRIDTIKHMPHDFWRAFSERMRARRPDLFMFAEHWSFDATAIAEHTWPENGAISVLDFPGKGAMEAVFANGGGYEQLADYLHLESGLYQNPYELMIFYDNHDMPRIDATDNGFIDAHNWLFTSRGIPVIYYGSEFGFRRGTPEHGGNRDYLGQQEIEAAKNHPIRDALATIAKVRQASIALQRGLQINVLLQDDSAAFLRVYQHGDTSQSALVLLNKSDGPKTINVDRFLDAGEWRDAVSGATVRVSDAGTFSADVAGHGVRVFVRNREVQNSALRSQLDAAMLSARRSTP